VLGDERLELLGADLLQAEAPTHGRGAGVRADDHAAVGQLLVDEVLAGGELGRAMRDGRAREVVAALGRRAGIDRVVTPHQFRHGLATELSEAGRSLDEIQMILGHAHVETTRRYTRTSRERLRDAIQSVALPAMPAPARS
jgi:integrase